MNNTFSKQELIKAMDTYTAAMTTGNETLIIFALQKLHHELDKLPETLNISNGTEYQDFGSNT